MPTTDLLSPGDSHPPRMPITRLSREAQPGDVLRWTQATQPASNASANASGSRTLDGAVQVVLSELVTAGPDRVRNPPQCDLCYGFGHSGPDLAEVGDDRGSRPAAGRAVQPRVPRCQRGQDGRLIRAAAPRHI